MKVDVTGNRRSSWKVKVMLLFGLHDYAIYSNRKQDGRSSFEGRAGCQPLAAAFSGSSRGVRILPEK